MPAELIYMNDIRKSFSGLTDALRKMGKTFSTCSAVIKVFSMRMNGLLFNKRIWHLAYKHKDRLVRKKNLKRLWGDDWLYHKII